jgi:hypothetical protein
MAVQLHFAAHGVHCLNGGTRATAAAADQTELMTSLP